MQQELNGLFDADIIILEADGKVDSNHGYGHLLQKRLQEFDINSYLVSLPQNADQLGRLPPKPLIISGGATEVTANIDWIVRSRDFIYKKLQNNIHREGGTRIPILGICFGAQLIAECFRKGSVTVSEEPEIGVTSVKLETSSHPLFKGYEHQYFDAYTFHYNQIGIKDVIALSIDSDHTRDFVEVFEIQGASCFGLQFHPEFEYDEFITLMETNREVISGIGRDSDSIIEDIKDIPSNAIILRNFFDYCREIQV